MDSLTRAKQFIAKKATKLALAVVPLAALTVVAPHPARAGVILTPATCTASTNGSGSCSVYQAGATGGNGGANWVALEGNGTSDVSGGFISFFVGFSGGAANGAFLSAGQVPVSWDFFVNASGGSAISWDVYFDIFNTSGGTSSFFQSGSTSPNTEVTGSGVINYSGGNVSAYDFGIDTSNNGSMFSLNVPGASTLDLNPGGSASPTPEPASLMLTAAGGAALLLARKKKKV